MLVKEKRRFLSRIVLVILGIVLLLGSMCFVCGNAEAKNIVKGDTTENIKIVQQRLYNLKYYTYKVDGIWGSRTLAAVKNFQRDNGLVADGIVGAKTEKALGVTLSQSGSTSLSSTELNLLARCVYSEARGEPYTGQVAVAAVVLNRVRNSSFPNTVSGVIYQPGAFTAVSDGDIQAPLCDYGGDGYPTGEPCVLGYVNYQQLKSGQVEWEGKTIRTAPMSSYSRALEIAEILKEWILSGKFELSQPVQPLPGQELYAGFLGR